jgi:hypothetical protein
MALLALGTLVILAFVGLGPIGHGWGFYFKISRMDQVRTIALAMFNYANEHDQAYPDGQSSTEVFQQLLDGQYVTDPRLFYIPMAGKVAALPGAKLKPENVCWDVTSGVGTYPPDDLPLVFMTGYKVTYAADASAVPLVRPYPPYWSGRWLSWWLDSDHESEPLPGIAVANANNNAFYKPLDPLLNSIGGEVLSAGRKTRFGRAPFRAGDLRRQGQNVSPAHARRAVALITRRPLRRRSMATAPSS